MTLAPFTSPLKRSDRRNFIGGTDARTMRSRSRKAADCSAECSDGWTGFNPVRNLPFPFVIPAASDSLPATPVGGLGAQRSGASTSSSPAIPTSVNRA